jgi:hypothetical protein
MKQPVKYYLLMTYPGQGGRQHLMNTGVKAVAADEDNKALLITMGERLLAENIISSYQIVMTIADEVNNMSKAIDICEKMDCAIITT